MKTIKVNENWFRGQYAEALENLQKGYEVTINDFRNGSWEATTKISRFINLLNASGINYTTEGKSLRTMIIRGVK